MLRTRILTALALLPIVFLLLTVAPLWVLAACLSVVVGLAAREWARMADLSEAKSSIYIVFALLVYVAWLSAEPLLTSLVISTATAALIVLATLLLPAFIWAFVIITQMNPDKKAGIELRLALGLIILPSAMASLVLLRALVGWQGTLFVLSIVWVADTAAYFSGKKFGKVKLAPRISPGKTREGVYGALIVVALYGLVFASFYPTILTPTAMLESKAVNALVQTVLAVKGSWSNTYVQLIEVSLGAVCLAMLSVFGDLYESLLKRQAGRKDSGTLLPGHGGVLDRIDALLPVLPVAALGILILL